MAWLDSGSAFSLSWYQASWHLPGPNDPGGMGITAYDVTDAEIYSNFVGEATIMPPRTWQSRSLSGSLPAGTHYVKVWQFSRMDAGVAIADCYIDDIVLNITAVGTIPLLCPGAESPPVGGLFPGWVNDRGTLIHYNSTTTMPAHSGGSYFAGRVEYGTALMKAWQQYPIYEDVVRPTLVDDDDSEVFPPALSEVVKIRPILVDDSDDDTFPFEIETIEPIVVVREMERNPYRAHLDDDAETTRRDLQEQQRIIRQQHNLTQAGDTTFDFGLLLQAYPNQEFTLGSAGRFFHDDFGLIEARYVQFKSMLNLPYQGQPVGRIKNKVGDVDWIVTNDYDKSSSDMILGFTFIHEPPPDDYYGWAVVRGANPSPIRVTGTTIPNQNDAYSWTSTGCLELGANGRIAARRWGNAFTHSISAGSVFITLEGPSIMDIIDLIHDEQAEIIEEIATLAGRVTVVEGKTATNTANITTQANSLVALTSRLSREELTRTREVAALRNAINGLSSTPSGIESLRAELTNAFTEADGVVMAKATTAYNIAVECRAQLLALDVSTLQTQLDDLTAAVTTARNAMGGLTIDFSTGVAGQTLVAATYTNSDGNNYSVLEPRNFTLVALNDYDNTTPATNGQVPKWNTVAGKWIPSLPVPDGDKGDITTSSSGTVWTIDNDAVTYAKIQNVSAAERILGRKTGGGAGDIQEMTLTEVLDLVLPGAMAQGDILFRGASSWARLPAGASGNVLQTNGTGANPSWAAPSGGGGGSSTPWYFDPPLATNLTLASNSGTSTATDDTDVGLRIVMPLPAAVNLRHMWYVTLPSPGADWDLKLRVVGLNFAGGTGVGNGLIAFESATGKAVSMERQNGDNLNLVGWGAGLNGARGNIQTAAGGDNWVVWFRMTRVSANYNIYLSANGKDWSLFRTEALTARFTTQPDRVGIFLLQDRTTGVGTHATCDFWSLT